MIPVIKKISHFIFGIVVAVALSIFIQEILPGLVYDIFETHFIPTLISKIVYFVLIAILALKYQKTNVTFSIGIFFGATIFAPILRGYFT